MSKIIRMIPQRFKKQYQTVYLEPDFKIKLHEEVIASHRLSEGSEVSEEQLEAIKLSEEKKEALEYAYMFLSYRTRSAKEMRDRLKRKGFSESTVELVLEDLRGKKLIDDVEFARNLTESRLKHKLLGEHRIRQDLIQKGIDREVAEKVLQDIKEQNPDEILTEEDRAYQALQKRVRMLRGEPRVIFRRLHDFLVRQGFSFDTVERALSRYRKEKNMEAGQSDGSGDVQT